MRPGPRHRARLLYGPLVDYVLSYHDATVIREGPAPDPKAADCECEAYETLESSSKAQGKYLFAMYPHGGSLSCFPFVIIVVFLSIAKASMVSAAPSPVELVVGGHFSQARNA